MFFELAQFSKFFLISPTTWIIACLIAFFCVRKKVLKYIFLGLTIVLFLVFTNPYLIDEVKYRQSIKYSKPTMKSARIYDAAIVMGGFSSVNKESGNVIFVEDRADRLWEAVRLYKDGKIRKILITGDPATLYHPDGSSTAELFLKYMEDFGIPREAFILEQMAKNTHENALFSKEIIEREHLDPNNLLLITSSTHIDRSMKVFAKEGIYPDYYAVGVKNKPESFSHFSLYPNWKAAEEWQEILNEQIGNLSYHLAGYI